MSLSFYEATVPVFDRYLGALSAILAKVTQHAEEHKIDPAVYCQARLFPDMHALARQVQLSSDFAKGTVARLAGQEPPKFADTETTLAELQGRLDRTIVFIRSVPREAFDGAEGRSITIPIGPGLTKTFPAPDFLLYFALPNFFFHVSTAYGILRANGIELTKKDYMGVS